ncbi:class I SAM-dependent methyltransferase [Luedemannella flava]|uniref:Class I SAM-dependent methyltransferase n=1 Tax=Luedemannella flava TaxID=349316 RepID=A0ABN2LY05_9ACTN
MSFSVAAEAYARFMGRFSEPLAVPFADYLELEPGLRALDVGCGPGALTAVLAARLGGGSVSAVDPSEPFVAAVRERLPGVDARHGVAEELPWPDDAFDRAAAQLVVHFMADPVAGLAEMARVTRPGGTVAATVWDFVGGTAPLTVFWRAALSVDPDAPGEARLAGTGPGQLDELLGRAGLVDVTSTMLTISVDFASFEQWWEPFTLGVGPAGAYLAAQPDDRRDTIRDACARLLPAGSFTLSAGAWAARGQVL